MALTAPTCPQYAISPRLQTVLRPQSFPPRYPTSQVESVKEHMNVFGWVVQSQHSVS
ncbi:hypothetical protein BDV19DRAFT_371099 [Aspergillus venezuelensis]